MRVGMLMVVLCLWAGAEAQSSSNQLNTSAVTDPASLGSVAGHVSLPESHLPARSASVALQPVNPQSQTASNIGEARLPVTVVQTGLDGGYRLDRVAPGSYYVVVGLPGYVSPITQFSQDQLKNPTPEVQQKIAATVPMVDVRPNNTATLDVSLTRGASLSGVLRYDDGSPLPGITPSLMKRNAAGKWDTVLMRDHGTTSDDEGRFRMFGLAPGEYVLHVSLNVMSQRASSAIGFSYESSSTIRSMIQFYGEGTVRLSEAKSFKLAEGQALDGQDLSIPVSKLHVVSGAVVDSHSGQPLNSGTVVLSTPEGGMITFGSIDPETRTFTLMFAPEGEYTLESSRAQEVQQQASSSGDLRRTPSRRSVRTYDTGKVPIVIHGDMQGITIPVTEKAP